MADDRAGSVWDFQSIKGSGLYFIGMPGNIIGDGVDGVFFK